MCAMYVSRSAFALDGLGKILRLVCRKKTFGGCRKCNEKNANMRTEPSSTALILNNCAYNILTPKKNDHWNSGKGKMRRNKVRERDIFWYNGRLALTFCSYKQVF